MLNYAGFKTILRLRQKNQPAGFIFNQMAKDYIVESVKTPTVNWRPRKPFLDSDFIDSHPTSFVDYLEIQETFNLLVN